MEQSRACRNIDATKASKEPDVSARHDQKAIWNGNISAHEISDRSDAEGSLHHDDHHSVRSHSVAGTDDTASINSRTRILSRRRQNSTLSLKSALRSYDDSVSQTGATATYLSSVHAARNPGGSRPKKTTGRKAFEVACGIVEVLITPLDINGEKTSMKESSLGQLFRGQHRDDSETGVMAGEMREKKKTKMVSMPY